MSSNAFARLEREYNERENAVEMAKAERERVLPCPFCKDPDLSVGKMNLINRFLWHYWRGQTEYLRQRLVELDAEENNLIEDRRKVRARLIKAKARVITYTQIPRI